MRRKSFHFKIGKVQWTILFVKIRGAFGWCYPDYKIILLDVRLKGHALRNTAIHEVLHALKWSKSEKQVRKATETIQEVLDAISP